MMTLISDKCPSGKIKILYEWLIVITFGGNDKESIIHPNDLSPLQIKGQKPIFPYSFHRVLCMLYINSSTRHNIFTILANFYTLRKAIEIMQKLVQNDKNGPNSIIEPKIGTE